MVARRLGCAATNLGVGGSLSTDTVALMHHEPPPPSRLYLVMTGLNDARLHGASPAALKSFGASLREILHALQAASPAALTSVVAQPRLADYSRHEPYNRGSDGVLDAYNECLRALVSCLPRIVVVNVSGWDPRAMLAADTVHPNDSGHAQVAAAVARVAVSVRTG